MTTSSPEAPEPATDPAPARAAGFRPAPPGRSTTRAVAALRRHLSRPRSPFWLEILFIVWLCWIYDAINNLSPLRVQLAYSDGRFLLHFERMIHLDPEAALDHWLAGHPALGWVAGNYYDNVHFITTLGLIGLVWWKFPDRYRPLRNGLVLTNLIAMVVFWLVPTAPPRLLDPAVYIDIVGQSHAFGSWHTGTLATAANQFAAMPSMHIGWAAWSSIAAWRILPKSRWTYLVWVYPVLTGLDVLATGNHYLCDVVAGLIVVAMSQVIADRWQGWWTAREARRALERPVVILGPVAGDGARAGDPVDL